MSIANPYTSIALYEGFSSLLRKQNLTYLIRPSDSCHAISNFARESVPIAVVAEYFALEELSDPSLLERNWDGEDAEPIQSETMKNARAAVTSFSNVINRADISPNPNGTISFEWESISGRAHLQIGRTKFSFYVKPKTGTPVYADGNAAELSNENISSFLGQAIENRLFPKKGTTTQPYSITANVTRIPVIAQFIDSTSGYCYA